MDEFRTMSDIEAYVRIGYGVFDFRLLFWTGPKEEHSIFACFSEVLRSLP